MPERHQIRAFPSLLLAVSVLGCATGPAVEERSPERPIVYPALTRDQISSVVSENNAAMEECYALEREQYSNATERITLRWVITPTGEVARVDVISTSLNSPVLEECARQTVLTWRFPRPKGGGVVQVTYPFDIDP